MSILHLCQSDTEGGAGRAALRLHKALLERGVRSTYAAGRRHLDDPDIVPAGPDLKRTEWTAFANALTARPFIRRSREPGLVSPAVFSYGNIDSALVSEHDVIVLHWISGAFLNPSDLASLKGKPILWRLSDIWPFSGGCHYPGSCRRFEADCGACPQLGSGWEHDITRYGWRARDRAYRNLNIVPVAPSRWIADRAKASSLFAGRRIEHIPTGVDLDIFRPLERNAARRSLKLPVDRKLILFGALASTHDPRKGFKELMTALKIVGELSSAQNTSLVVFGNWQEVSAQDEIGMPLIALGHISDDNRLADLFSAADVFVAPFLEDNLPNVALEAMACGAPIVAFDTGGMPDIVTDRKTGRLVRSGDSRALAHAIEGILGDNASESALRVASRDKAVVEFGLQDCAARYAALASDLTSNTGTSG